MNGASIVLLLAIAATAAGIACGVTALRIKGTLPRAVNGILAVACLAGGLFLFSALYPALFDPRYKVYKGFYAAIQTGMSKSQVMDLMSAHYPADGARGVPKVMDEMEDRLGFFMNPERSSEPNCEGIFLLMEKGVVTRKEYLAD